MAPPSPLPDRTLIESLRLYAEKVTASHKDIEKVEATGALIGEGTDRAGRALGDTNKATSSKV